MNDRLTTIVDLNRYPIQDLNSPIIKKLIERCKKELDEDSCSTIPNFILPKSLEIMNQELEKQLDEVYMSKEKINAYLYAKDLGKIKFGIVEQLSSSSSFLHLSINFFIIGEFKS
jgi:hypothetical protein